MLITIKRKEAHQKGIWSSGMILALGARGPEFDSRNAPICLFYQSDRFQMTTTILIFCAEYPTRKLNWGKEKESTLEDFYTVFCIPSTRGMEIRTAKRPDNGKCPEFDSRNAPKLLLSDFRGKLCCIPSTCGSKRIKTDCHNKYHRLGIWSSGMILALGARGPEFDSRNAPFFTLAIMFGFLSST
ncbi:hypothetical protein POTOM_033102 [Populus tomentosa]|uniref:Uncharacterized protein n=1 Tax=Populus tomentosa TaxID=118781 RepID=A0A8X8CHA8_POPTO|nr:hypothetical protein POTOM_033102 [Populus tomentosa]